jgi:hypothetical protein
MRGPEVTPQVYLVRPIDGRPAAPATARPSPSSPGPGHRARLSCAALAAGGTCEGPPGLRPHYHPDYYGAYVRDLDGHKIACVCHLPEG